MYAQIIDDTVGKTLAAASTLEKDVKAELPRTVLLGLVVDSAVRTPECTHSGLGSFPFARRYLGNRQIFFLFLRLLRCFSSPGSLRIPMDSVYGD